MQKALRGIDTGRIDRYGRVLGVEKMNEFVKLEPMPKKFKTLYLDVNIYNRPFDDQSQVRIKLETIAIFSIFKGIKEGSLKLVWSFMIDYENYLNPHDDVKEEVQLASSMAKNYITADEQILRTARIFEDKGIKARDAIHLSCATYENIDYFITCDDRLIKKASTLNLKFDIINPVDFAYSLEVIKHDTNDK